MENHPHLKDLQALGPLEVFRADLEDEGSFDEAVAGCDYAFLVAAPMNLNAENPEVEPDQTLCTRVRFDYGKGTVFSWLYLMAERSDRAGRQRNRYRNEVVREGGDGEARDPDIVSGGCRRPASATRRQPCPG